MSLAYEKPIDSGILAPPMPALLLPLSAFPGRELDAFVVDPERIPEPYQSLLVHSGDMTSKLEEHHGGPLTLRVLNQRFDGDAYRREVVLLAPENFPVEYGAIRIHLDAFPEVLRPEILGGTVPLGGILNSAGFRYYSRPIGFLRVEADPQLAEWFGIELPQVLYGRSNQLLGEHGRVLASIVEILRP